MRMTYAENKVEGDNYHNMPAFDDSKDLPCISNDVSDRDDI